MISNEQKIIQALQTAGPQTLQQIAERAQVPVFDTERTQGAAQILKRLYMQRLVAMEMRHRREDEKRIHEMVYRLI